MTDTIETAFGRFTAASGRRVNLTNDYERCALRSFRDAADAIKASVIVDVGANVGVYSIFTASLPAIREVHAFEPEQHAFSELAQNIDLHPDARKITPHKAALSDTAGSATLSVIEPMHGMNSILVNGAAGEPVKLRKLDDALPFQGKTTCVKIDVEGHERKVISGAADFLSKNPSYLQVECLEGVVETELLLSSVGYSPLFILNYDCLFLHRDLEQYRRAILDAIYANLSADLDELTKFRLDARARRRARRAESLRQSDPQS